VVPEYMVYNISHSVCIPYIIFLPSSPSPAVVTIGFEQTTYSVYEGLDVEVCVNLLSGGLAVNRTVVVTISTDDVLGSGGMLGEYRKSSNFSFSQTRAITPIIHYTTVLISQV
jgi:hypothetical protein